MKNKNKFRYVQKFVVFWAKTLTVLEPPRKSGICGM